VAKTLNQHHSFGHPYGIFLFIAFFYQKVVPPGQNQFHVLPQYHTKVLRQHGGIVLRVYGNNYGEITPIFEQ